MRTFPVSIGTISAVLLFSRPCRCSAAAVKTAFVPLSRIPSPSSSHYRSSNFSQRQCMKTTSAMTMMSSEIEVEEKFALPQDGSWASVEAKLTQLGFVPKSSNENGSDDASSIKFTDTYYDLPAPNWYLTPRDCWLRFRGQKVAVANNDGGGSDSNNDDKKQWRGKWQLKIRRRSKDDVGAATAYEEIEGEDALSKASEMLPTADIGNNKGSKDSNDNDSLFDDAPKAPDGLIPFAQFETSRSTWVLPKESSSAYVGLTVDIDATDFGYGVGEVEAILKPGDDMADARKRIGRLVAEISGDGSISSNLPTLGKLETYLIDRRREQYDAIIS